MTLALLKNETVVGTYPGSIIKTNGMPDLDKTVELIRGKRPLIDFESVKDYDFKSENDKNIKKIEEDNAQYLQSPEGKTKALKQRNDSAWKMVRDEFFEENTTEGKRHVALKKVMKDLGEEATAKELYEETVKQLT